MIHTTFAVVFAFVFVAWLFASKPRLALGVALLLAYAGAYSGGALFDMFGGRRLGIYSVQDGATSINYVLAGLLCILPSLYWLATASPADKSEGHRILSVLALAHVGTTVFTLFSFFIFPLGASRVGYVTQLLLIPVLPALRHHRRSRAAVAIFALLVLYLVYLVAKSYLEGTYRIYFGA
jgi:hypothetical protein